MFVATLLSIRLTFTSMESAPTTFLEANTRLYDRLARRIQVNEQRGKPEAILRSVILAATAASEFYPGRFADGSIENAALVVGMNLVDSETDCPAPMPASDRKRRRVLHVTTQVTNIGGHTRMLYHWIRNDQSSCHSLAITHQGTKPIPTWLSGAVMKNGSLTLLSPKLSLTEKAKQLRTIARSRADLVVLHHYPFDVVPIVAFASGACPPVAVVNVADHQFWLGSSVADIVISLRQTGSEHAAARRFALVNTVLPVPLEDKYGRVPRRDARATLGIPDDQVMLLSVGRPEKYEPCDRYSFVDTAAKILGRQSKAHIYVVGESHKRITRRLRRSVHERLHFVGPIEDPTIYRAGTDIYLESFPFGSQTALLEAALSGIPVVPAYAPLFPLLVANDDCVYDLIPNPKNEHEYLERTCLLIEQPRLRNELGLNLRRRLLANHVESAWSDRLAGVYRETDSLVHRPHPIGVSTCSTTAEDTNLSLWHAKADREPGYRIATVLRHSARIATQFGDYSGAARDGWRAMCSNPCHRASWCTLIRAILGRRLEQIVRSMLLFRRRSLQIQGRLLELFWPIR
jgi:glycosyltransferase involved in cell wall biosynthesis